MSCGYKFNYNSKFFPQPTDDFGGVIGSESEEDVESEEEESDNEDQDDLLPIEKASKKLQAKRKREL